MSINLIKPHPIYHDVQKSFITVPNIVIKLFSLHVLFTNFFLRWQRMPRKRWPWLHVTWHPATWMISDWLVCGSYLFVCVVFLFGSRIPYYSLADGAAEGRGERVGWREKKEEREREREWEMWVTGAITLMPVREETSMAKFPSKCSRNSNLISRKSAKRKCELMLVPSREGTQHDGTMQRATLGPRNGGNMMRGEMAFILVLCICLRKIRAGTCFFEYIFSFHTWLFSFANYFNSEVKGWAWWVWGIHTPLWGGIWPNHIIIFNELFCNTDVTVWWGTE